MLTFGGCERWTSSTRHQKERKKNPKEMRVVVDKRVLGSLIMESTLTCSFKKWYLSMIKI